MKVGSAGSIPLGSEPLTVDWDEVRAREFPVAREWAYLDHAAIAPLPRRAAEAMRLWCDHQERSGCVSWLTWRQRLETVRADAARLIGADPVEIAFSPSTTLSIGLIAEGFPWREGDNLISISDEYPSNVYPWMNLAGRGVSMRTVQTVEGRVDVDAIARAFDAKTRLVALSFVEFATGFRNDLDRIGQLCRDRGAALFVDAIQGLGALPLDVSKTPIDFLAADSHKWLLGPEAAGFLYVRRAWIDRLHPIGVGANSVENPYNYSSIAFQLKGDAGRWEGGCYNMPGLLAFGKSLELFHELGVEAVTDRVADRAEAVRERAQRTGWRVFGSDRPEQRSGIVSLVRDGVDPMPLVSRFRDLGVVLSCRGGRLRISPHMYTDQGDLDKLEQGLRNSA